MYGAARCAFLRVSRVATCRADWVFRREDDEMNARPDNLHERAAAILDFWFGPRDHADFGTSRGFWFQGGPEFDESVKEAFKRDVDAARGGAYDSWRESPSAALALVILFDQFPRNIYRGDPLAFATDPRARALSTHILDRAWDKDMSPVEQLFVYLPFEHSEDIGDQRRSVELFENMAPHENKPEWIDFARRHLVIVERFGRFPHRNRILGRADTDEERVFLAQPNSGF